MLATKNLLEVYDGKPWQSVMEPCGFPYITSYEEHLEMKYGYETSIIRLLSPNIQDEYNKGYFNYYVVWFVAFERWGYIDCENHKLIVV